MLETIQNQTKELLQKSKVQEQMVPSAGFSPQSDPYESEYMHKFSQQPQTYTTPIQQQQQHQPAQHHQSEDSFCSLADTFDLSLLGDHYDDQDMATVPSPSWSPAMTSEPTSWQQLSFYAASPSSDLNGFSGDIKPALSPDGSFIKAYSPASPPASGMGGVKGQPLGLETGGMDSATRNFLLRQCLEDTTFQRKYNVKPLELPLSSLFGEADLANQQDMTSTPETSGLELNQIEPVFSMAFDQIRTDIQSACSSLAISPDPIQWSGQDVQKWLAHIFATFPTNATMQERSMDVAKALGKFWNFDGPALCALSEEELRLHEPNYGYLIFHQLELWKMLRGNKACSAQLPQEVSFASADYDMEQIFNSSFTTAESPMQPTTVAENFEEPPSVVSDIIVPTMVNSPSSSFSSPSADTDAANTDGTDEEEEEEEEMEKLPAGKSKGGNGQKSGAHIHLWQFLKELLASPQQHGSCIRWLDQSRGVFKIEDSVRVARLWGLRKNRPAMNYDKLSRSIRQYYRKGIMRKTERSQRLVYQFCHPYGL